MTKVAEYLGQRTDVAEPVILSAIAGAMCPFMSGACSKVTQGNKPICSVRGADGIIWIACRNRLCATSKGVLSAYQANVLFGVAKVIFGHNIAMADVGIRREVSMPLGAGKSYHADFVMVRRDAGGAHGQSRVVLEMQGGGETSNTGRLTRRISEWEAAETRTNLMLDHHEAGVGLIVTNAWRRQQEQFLVKGNIATQTGGGMVFCVGTLLYDHLLAKLHNVHMQDLAQHNWTLALVEFKEDNDVHHSPISFSVDRTLFTNYATFVQGLTNQGAPQGNLFSGNFESLDGHRFDV